MKAEKTQKGMYSQTILTKPSRNGYLEDNRTEAVKVAKIIANTSLRERHYFNDFSLVKSYNMSRNVPPLASSPIQRVQWTGWTNRFLDETMEASTIVIAKLGMAIVNYLVDIIGCEVRIGGSLAARMEGAPRLPADIDLDYAGGGDIASIKDALLRRLQRYNVPLVLDQEMFFIKNAEKKSRVIEIQFCPIPGVSSKDFFEEDGSLKDDAPPLKKIVEKLPVLSTSIDISSEAIFTAGGMLPDRNEAELGYYEADYLIASYLNRIDTDSLTAVTKNDEMQIISMLQRMLSITKPEDPLLFLQEKMRAIIERHIVDPVSTKTGEKPVSTKTEEKSKKERICEIFEGIIQKILSSSATPSSAIPQESDE